jgi:hypothetical protein
MSEVFQQIDSTAGDQKIVVYKENPRGARGFSNDVRRASGSALDSADDAAELSRLEARLPQLLSTISGMVNSTGSFAPDLHCRARPAGKRRLSPSPADQVMLPGRKQRIDVPSDPLTGQTIVRPARFGSVMTASSGTVIHSPSRRTR